MQHASAPVAMCARLQSSPPERQVCAGRPCRRRQASGRAAASAGAGRRVPRPDARQDRADAARPEDLNRRLEAAFPAYGGTAMQGLQNFYLLPAMQ